MVMSEKNKMVVNIDRISNLPDTLLHLLLSGLDITEVFQKTVLSKRWSSLCTSLPFLNFDYKTFYTLKFKKKDIKKYNKNQQKDLKRFCHEEFMDVVNKVIVFHDNKASNIHTIRLSDSFGYLNTTWLHVAVLGNLQELYLNLACVECKFKLPQCLLTCKSLVTLKLVFNLLVRNDWTRYVCVDLPKLVNLPKLKTLQLLSFCFYGGSKFIQKFLLGSPDLETLSIIKCSFHGTISIYATQLMHLEIDNIFGCVRGCGIYSTSSNSEITIYAPLLMSLKIRGYVSDEYSVEGLSSLVKADIDMAVRKPEGESDTDGEADDDDCCGADSDTDSDDCCGADSDAGDDCCGSDSDSDSIPDGDDRCGACGGNGDECCDSAYEYDADDANSDEGSEADSDDGSEADSKADSDTNASMKERKNMIMLLGGLSYAKSLTVSAPLLEVIGSKHIGEHLPIPFSALRQLRLNTTLSRESIQSIKFIMRNTCILEKLVVEIVRVSIQREIWEFWDADLLSDLEGIYDHLRFVEFRNVRGGVITLQILKGLLKNATGLEKLIIFISKGQPLGGRMQLMEKIMAFPKASSSAAVLFS